MFIRIKLMTFIIVSACLLGGCQEDLFPSNDQLSNPSSAEEGSLIEDITFTLSSGNSDTLSSRLQSSNLVVLYFTMWCPVCDSHMSHIRSQFKSQYPNVDFLFVDYVSGSVSASNDSRLASGYGDFDVIGDADNQVQNLLGGTMASTIVIDQNFIIQMNEEFKDGSRLQALLNNL